MRCLCYYCKSKGSTRTQNQGPYRNCCLLQYSKKKTTKKNNKNQGNQGPNHHYCPVASVASVASVAIFCFVILIFTIASLSASALLVSYHLLPLLHFRCVSQNQRSQLLVSLRHKFISDANAKGAKT